MRKSLNLINLAIILLLNIATTFGQNSQNMQWLSKYDPSTDGYNDIWGYVDELGNEYAIFGSKDSIYFIDVTECDNPKYIYGFDGASYNWWRDFKVYNDYVYAVCDGCSEGLHVFDMGPLPNGNIQHVGTFKNDLYEAHNIFIDEPNHRMYAIDVYHPSTGDDDIIIYDLQSNPSNPNMIYKGYLGGGGIHDANVKDNLIYTSHYYGDKFEVYDVSNVNNIIQLESVGNLNGAHSSWNDATEDYAYLAAEVPNQPFRVIDLGNVSSTVNDIYALSNSFWDPLENASGLIAHNPFVVNDFLYISHYEDGVKVYDISNRTNPVVAGYCDIYPQNDGFGYGGFYGTWGIYPFFPSGCIIASDDTNGLNMMQLDRSISDTCTPILNINNQVQSDHYSASNYVKSVGQVISGSVPKNVLYTAEHYVELNAGFEVNANSNFEADIEPCSPNN